MEKETRTIGSACEVRKGAESTRTISGYAALYNVETVIGAGPFAFREVIAPGAFSKAIGRDDVRALFNHDANLVLGRTPTTLRLSEDEKGLRYDIDLPDTTTGRDVEVLVARGDVSQSSFGFAVDEQRWAEPQKRGELPLRTIVDTKLYDVSPVTYPAYEQTSVSASARSQAKALAEAPIVVAKPARDVKRALRALDGYGQI